MIEVSQFLCGKTMVAKLMRRHHHRALSHSSDLTKPNCESKRASPTS